MNKLECKHCLKLGRVAALRVCGGCKRCKEHSGCHCITCQHCQRRKPPKDICPKCASCLKHHAQPFGNAKDFPLRKCEFETEAASFRLNPLRRRLGCEFEMTAFNGIASYRSKPLALTPHLNWHLEHDGSVHGSGEELVTARMVGDGYMQGMSELVAAVQQHRCAVDSSCGFHVHVEGADLDALALRRLIVGFQCIQEGLYGTLVAAGRRSNVFCPPLELDRSQLHSLMAMTKPADINNWFHSYLYGLTPPEVDGMTSDLRLAIMHQFERKLHEVKSRKYQNQARRQALNFHSWMMRGTVEFRLHEGTVSPADMLMWPLWCGWFVEKVGGMSDKEVLWWLKSPPSILELSERFAQSPNRMPKAILEWVREKCEGKVKPKAKAGPLLDISAPPEATLQWWIQRYSANAPGIDS